MSSVHNLPLENATSFQKLKNHPPLTQDDGDTDWQWRPNDWLNNKQDDGGNMECVQVPQEGESQENEEGYCEHEKNEISLLRENVTILNNKVQQQSKLKELFAERANNLELKLKETSFEISTLKLEDDYKERLQQELEDQSADLKVKLNYLNIEARSLRAEKIKLEHKMRDSQISRTSLLANAQPVDRINPYLADLFRAIGRS